MKYREKLFIVIGLLVIIFLGIGLFLMARKLEQFSVAINSNIHRSSEIENYIVQNFPIFEDYLTPVKENELRKFLLMRHLAIGNQFGLSGLESDENILKNARSGLLKEQKTGGDVGFYFYNVPAKYRFVTPNTARGLAVIYRTLNQFLKTKDHNFQLKIAISSMIRPENYQQRLRNKNANASFISSHSFGVSFDIFYDDFFVSVPTEQIGNAILQKILDAQRNKIGFLLGDSLSRQFHAALHQTLIDLQNQNILYAIIEKKQKCYHVTILPQVKEN